MPARDRVYNEIKMRAAVRYPAVTVAQIVGETNRNVMLGGYALPGIFTQKAWDEYVDKAIEDAANKPTDTKDWVLNSTQSDDLTFSGSPDQIRKQLTQLYKQEYIAEWKKFINATHYAKGPDFVQQAKIMDVLGEPQNSPIRTYIDRVAKETSWDNPVVQAELAAPQTGFVAWFKRKVLGQGKSDEIQRASNQAQGQISQQFQVFYQLVRKRDDLQDKSLLDDYLQNMAQVRSKLNDLRSAGDFGPSALALAKQTINDQSSVFNATQKVVDEKLTVGLGELDQQMVQKLLVSPLTQSFDSLLTPAQDEINKLWTLQAYQPFSQTLSQKVPFNSSGTIQATSNEISQIFGDNGSISKFVKETLDPFVIRRGYTLSSKTWKNMGVGLNPEFVMNFEQYTTPINGASAGAAGGGAPAANQSNFQFYPIPNNKLLSYSIDIDGQRLVYENGIQQWVNFMWPNPGAIPGARITAIDLDGQTHTIFEEPGEYGINKLIDSAQRKPLNGSFEMTWTSKQNSDLFVKLQFRLISGNASNPIGSNRGYVGLKLVDRVTSPKAALVVAAQQAPATASNPQASSPFGGGAASSAAAPKPQAPAAPQPATNGGAQ
jgi:type VI secretion system protein ImpL